MPISERPASTSSVQSAITGAEYFGLATVPLSQFFGWVFPNVAFLPIALAVRLGKFGRLTPILGVFLVLFSTAGGLGFIYPNSNLPTFQLPALALEGLFSLGLGVILMRLPGKRTAS